MHNLLQAIKLSNKNFAGLPVYGVVMTLEFNCTTAKHKLALKNNIFMQKKPIHLGEYPR